MVLIQNIKNETMKKKHKMLNVRFHYKSKNAF